MKHRAFGLLFTAILLLASPLCVRSGIIGPGAETTDPSVAPALAVVQKFTEMRSAGDFAGAYQLFLPGDLMALKTPMLDNGMTPYDLIVKSGNVDRSSSLRQSPIIGMMAYFFDTKGKSQMAFDAYGVDPKKPNIVWVHFKSPEMIEAHTMTIVTARDRRSGELRIAPMATSKLIDPYFARAFEGGAFRTVSENNMKQIGLAILQYVQDHDERYPDANHWMDQIKPYLKSESLLRDPAAPDGEKYSYAFNRNLSGRSLAEIADPNKTVAIFESRASKRNASDTGASRPKPGRHLNGTDYLFADGYTHWIADSAKAPSFKL